MTLKYDSGKQLSFRSEEKCNVEIPISADFDLNKADKVEFQFPNSWLVLTGPSFTRAVQTENPDADHYFGISSDGAEFDVNVASNNKYLKGGLARHGRLVTGILKSDHISAGKAIILQYLNTFAGYISYKREDIIVKVNDEEITVPIAITPQEPVLTRVIAPSTVEPNEEFEILVVNLDKHYGCVSEKYSNKSLTLSNGSVIAENLSYTGSVKVKTSISEEGIFRAKYDDLESNAILVKKGVKKIFWGDTHIHTDLSIDGQGYQPYEYARNVSGLDFAAAADHSEGLGNKGYEIVLNWAETHNKPGSFVTLLADERNPYSATGHHNIYFKNEEALKKFRTLYNENGEEDRRDDMIENFDSDILFFPHHTGIGFGRVNWDKIADKVNRPVVEIYSHHGQSEVYCPHHILSYEFNRMRNPELRSNKSGFGKFYAQDYLKDGVRIGFIGSSDEHTGQGGKPHGGIAAVFSKELNRDGIFNAINNRDCYATTGERILIDFKVNDTEMGKEVKFSKGSKIKVNFDVWATENIIRAEILRYRKGIDNDFEPVESFYPTPQAKEAKLEYEEELEADTIYYARVIQYPLEWPGMAWASPIWVDVF
ncbi:MAG: DUF3604 domain-containing protein [Planctomycetota bacterium]|jgi:hypothetical protein